MMKIENKIYRKVIESQLISYLVDINFFRSSSKIENIKKKSYINFETYDIIELVKNNEMKLNWHIFSKDKYHKKVYNFIKKYEKILEVKNQSKK